MVEIHDVHHVVHIQVEEAIKEILPNLLQCFTNKFPELQGRTHEAEDELRQVAHQMEGSFAALRSKPGKLAVSIAPIKVPQVAQSDQWPSRTKDYDESAAAWSERRLLDSIDAEKAVGSAHLEVEHEAQNCWGVSSDVTRQQDHYMSSEFSAVSLISALEPPPKPWI